MMSRPAFRGDGMRPTLAIALVLALLLPGCNYITWYKQEGFVNVNLHMIGPQDTSLGDFRELQVALKGVTINQYLVLQPHFYSFGDQPKVLDLVAAGTKGQVIPLVSHTNMSVRAIESITLTMEVIKATDAAGKDVPVCHDGDQVTQFPCFFAPDNDAYRHQDRNIALQRGGTITVNFPLAVLRFNNNKVGQDPEYALIEDPTLLTVDVKK